MRSKGKVESPAEGYARPADHLADFTERFAILFERLKTVRAALPDAAVLSEPERRGHLAPIADQLKQLLKRLQDLDARVAARTAASAEAGVALPLELLRARLGLSPLDQLIVALAATMERGSAFNQYESAASKETPQPDVAFFVALLADGELVRTDEVRLRFAADRPLVESGTILLAPGAGWAPDSPLMYKRVRLSERVLDFLEGASDPPETVLKTAGSFVRQPPPVGELLLDEPSVVEDLARALADERHVAVVNGTRGVGRRALTGAAARVLDKPVLTIDLTELPLDGGELVRTLTPLLREARLQGAVLVLADAHLFADGEGQWTVWPLLTERLRALDVPLAILGERTPKWIGRVGRIPVEFAVPFPSPETQRRLWVRHLPASLRLEEGLSIEAVVKRYSLSCGSIREAADELERLDRIHAWGGLVSEEELSAVIRRRLAHRLGALAQVVRTTLDWKDVILPDDVLDRVFEFLDYAAQRERVMSEWGFARKLPYGRGLSALFAGPPGTGKTMICSLLAKELGVELYRIDLSQVVNKYIGETEKNLGRVFDEAAHGQVMLLFDEADSIFAKRTEVKSSHDRYANLEVNYLLQRMENFDGIVVLTTNSETAIDPAFRRRIRFRVRFPAPDETHREQLWRGMIPAEAHLSAENPIDFKLLAKKFPMAGGNIMNAVVRAAISAAADGEQMAHRHLQRAAELEYAEMGFLA
jgi:MoxR-like ATPase